MLRIEPISMKYVAEVQQFASDPRVAANTLLPEPYPENGAEMFIEWVNLEENKGHEFHYAIVVDEVLVGMVGITRIDWENKTGEIGYWIGTPYWGKGYATEAVKQMTKIGFEELKLVHIVAIILKRNPISMRVVEKVGYRYIGEIVEKYEKFLGKISVEYGIANEKMKE